MGQKLRTALPIHRLAADLGLGSSADPVTAVREYCRQQLLQFLAQIPCRTLTELLLLAQDRLGTVFVEIHSDADLADVQKEFVGRGEVGFAALTNELSAPDVFAITIRLLAPKPWERPFVSVIDCRGQKSYRAYFSKWHELAHLLTLTRQMRLKFRRTHMTEEANDPEERLMELIAGDGAFLPELITPHAHEVISFETIERLRSELCPDASNQASRIGFVQAWPSACLLLRAELALRKDQQRTLTQGRFEFFETPEPVLRAVEVTTNSAAKDAGLCVPRNMRIPGASVISRALAEWGDLEADEDFVLVVDEPGTEACLVPCSCRGPKRRRRRNGTDDAALGGTKQMAQLPKFTLEYDERTEKWDLNNDKTDRTVKSFDTKAEATARGVLKRAIGGEGSVKIQKQSGRFQEERTFPRSKDPKKSRG